MSAQADATPEAGTVGVDRGEGEAIVKTPARTGLPKVKRAELDARTVVDALRYEGLLSDEAHLRIMTTGHLGLRAPRYLCPTCGEDASRIAMVKVAFTYEPCDCDAAPYVHLVEQLWHREHVGPPRSTS